MSYTTIHETIIRDVVDVISDVKKSDEIQGILNRNKSFSSIANASSNLTLVFPVIVSKNINIENAGMVAKAIERKAVTMLQMLFSAINISNSENGIQYLKNFHSNLKMDNDVNIDTFIDAMDTFVIQNEANITYSDREHYRVLKNDLRNIDFSLGDNINETSLNTYKIHNRFGQQVIVKEDVAKDIHDFANSIGGVNIQFGGSVKSSGGGGSYSNRDELSKAKDITSIEKNRHDMIRNQILDTEIKKANELIPSMMIVNYVNMLDGSEIPQQMVIGVKAKMYPIDSTDMINRIRIKNEDNNGLLKFVRATTREISFFRDFVFAIERAKIDALSQSNRGSSSKLWKVLERRATKSKARRSLGQTNDASAITTLVISQEEVEYLKKNENLNIENPKIMRPIMEAYNLMGISIVDESMEVVKFLFDTGDDLYESLSFIHLERETSDNGYKKVINLMTKISR